MGQALSALGRLLFTSLAYYGGWKVVENVTDGPDVVVNTSGPVSTVADKLGINRVLVYLALAIAAILALRFLFKSKSI